MQAVEYKDRVPHWSFRIDSELIFVQTPCPHYALKTGFVKGGFGGGFAEPDSVESKL